MLIVFRRGRANDSGERTRLACCRWRLANDSLWLNRKAFRRGAENSTRGRVRSPERLFRLAAETSTLAACAPQNPITPVTYVTPLASALLQGAECQSTLILCASPAFRVMLNALRPRLF